MWSQLVGEHIKARKAQIDKIRILKHEVRGDMPMAHLLKHSTHFVTDAVLAMQLVALSGVDDLDTSSNSEDDGGGAVVAGASDAPRKEVKRSKTSNLSGAKQRLKLQHQKRLQRVAQQTWGWGRGEYKWYLFSDCLMVTRVPASTRLWTLLRCGKAAVKMPKLKYVALFDLNDMDLDDLSHVTLDQVDSSDQLVRVRTWLRRISFPVRTTTNSTGESPDVAKVPPSANAASAANAANANAPKELSDWATTTRGGPTTLMSRMSAAVVDTVGIGAEKPSAKLVHRGTRYHVWAESHEQMVALVAQVQSLKAAMTSLPPTEGGVSASPSDTRLSAERRVSVTSAARRRTSMSPGSPLGLGSTRSSFFGAVGGPTAQASADVGIQSLVLEMRLLEDEVDQLRLLDAQHKQQLATREAATREAHAVTTASDAVRASLAGHAVVEDDMAAAASAVLPRTPLVAASATPQTAAPPLSLTVESATSPLPKGWLLRGVEASLSRGHEGEEDIESLAARVVASALEMSVNAAAEEAAAINMQRIARGHGARTAAAEAEALAIVARRSQFLEATFGPPFAVVLIRPSVDVSLGVNIEYMEAHGLPEISFIAPGGLTDSTSQVQLGDVITEINGVETTLGPQVLVAALGSAQDVIELTVRALADRVPSPRISKVRPPGAPPPPMEALSPPPSSFGRTLSTLLPSRAQLPKPPSPVEDLPPLLPVPAAEHAVAADADVDALATDVAARVIEAVFAAAPPPVDAFEPIPTAELADEPHVAMLHTLESLVARLEGTSGLPTPSLSALDNEASRVAPLQRGYLNALEVYVDRLEDAVFVGDREAAASALQAVARGRAARADAQRLAQRRSSLKRASSRQTFDDQWNEVDETFDGQWNEVDETAAASDDVDDDEPDATTAGANTAVARPPSTEVAASQRVSSRTAFANDWRAAGDDDEDEGMDTPDEDEDDGISSNPIDDDDDAQPVSPRAAHVEMAASRSPPTPTPQARPPPPPLPPPRLAAAAAPPATAPATTADGDAYEEGVAAWSSFERASLGDDADDLALDAAFNSRHSSSGTPIGAASAVPPDFGGAGIGGAGIGGAGIGGAGIGGAGIGGAGIGGAGGASLPTFAGAAAGDEFDEGVVAWGRYVRRSMGEDEDATALEAALEKANGPPMSAGGPIWRSKSTSKPLRRKASSSASPRAEVGAPIASQQAWLARSLAGFDNDLNDDDDDDDAHNDDEDDDTATALAATRFSAGPRMMSPYGAASAMADLPRMKRLSAPPVQPALLKKGSSGVLSSLRSGGRLSQIRQQWSASRLSGARASGGDGSSQPSSVREEAGAPGGGPSPPSDISPDDDSNEGTREAPVAIDLPSAAQPAAPSVSTRPPKKSPSNPINEYFSSDARSESRRRSVANWL